jgi:hypothetical protein
MSRLNDSLVFIVAFIAMVVLIAGVQQERWLPTSLVHADSSQNVSGYAWSSNVGWISFNCSNDNSCGTANYGLNIDSNGNVSGNAWSSSVGWISFNQTSGCPEAGCTTTPHFDKTSGALTGWARACGGTENRDCTGASRTDGWDGWIKLAGTSYGPVFSGITFAGYSWGSDVVGWLSWSGTGYGVVSPANIDCTSSLSVAPDTIDQGENVALSWSVSAGSACATSCSGNGFDTGGATSGNNGPASVPPTPPTTSYALTCTGGEYGTPPPANATVTVRIPEVTLTVNGRDGATRVNQNTPDNATIAWESINATSCTVTRSPTASGWPKSGLSSAGVVDSVTVQTKYRIDCVNSHDTHAIAQVVVNILAGFNEF